MLLDNYKHKGMRKALIKEIRKKGFQDEVVLKAIEAVPRHFFLDKGFVVHAYEDKAFPIGEDQTISQPYTVAVQTQLLDLKKGDKVLEIGTGSGYQCCVLLEMGSKVFSIEYNKVLFNKTKQLLEQMGYKPKLFLGDGSLGLPQFAPFDKILITAAAPYVSDKLLKQLKLGGTMVVPVGSGKVQKMQKIVKYSETDVRIVDCGDFKFVPLRGKEGQG